MSVDSLKQLVAKAENDSGLQAELQETGGNKDKLVAVAANHGFSVTAGDIDSFRETAELDEGALDKVAGGGSGHVTILYTLVCGGGKG